MGYQAYISRPLGSGTSSPLSFVVSIHSFIIIPVFAIAYSTVAPSAIHPGSSGTSTIKALSS